MCVPKTSDNIQINIRMPNPSQEPPASSKAPNQDLKDMDVLCTFKIKIESQNFEYGCTKDQWPYPNQYQDANPQSRTSSILKSQKSGLKGHGWFLQLQNQDANQNSEHGHIKDQWPCANYDHVSKSQSRTSTILQAPNQGSKIIHVLCTLKIKR